MRSEPIIYPSRRGGIALRSQGDLSAEALATAEALRWGKRTGIQHPTSAVGRDGVRPALTQLLNEVVNTRTKLNVLQYFRGNPRALETAGSMSGRLHRPPEGLDVAMDQLARAGAFRTARSGAARERVYAYAPTEQMRERLKLLWAALDGPNRDEFMQQLIQREGEVRWQEVADLRRLDDLKGRFVSLVSHKLRTPLTVLKGLLDTLVLEPEMPTERRARLVGLAHKHCDDLIGLIESLLTLAGMQRTAALELELAPVPLDEVLEEAADRARLRAEGHEILVELSGIPPQTVMDRDKIATILDDLLDNAVKFSPSGGRVTLSARESQDHVELTVDDEGIGLPAAEIDRVFERFYQFRAEGEASVTGAGLGLFLAREVINAHGGRIWIEHKSTPGLRVRLSLPVGGPAAARGHTNEQTAGN